MGNNLVKKAKKKRDKKYDPYKLIKRANKALAEGTDNLLKEAVEYDEEGSIKLDEAGKPIFKDTIKWDTDSAQIMAIWTCHKVVLENRLVPPNDQDAAFDSMSLYAKVIRETTKKYEIEVPINYFVGTWHILNTCRKFSLFKDDKKMAIAIDGLTMWFAKQIDIYQEVKRRERVQDEVSPNEILSAPKNINKFEEFREKSKAIPFKK